mgnify:FL=1
MICLGGAAGLVYDASISFFEGNNWYGIFVVIATMGYGIQANEVKSRLADFDGVTITALSFFFIGPVAGIYLLLSDFSFALSTPDYLLNFGYIALLATFGSVIAIIFFNKLIQATTPVFAASVTYIIPVFAIFWGLFDDEVLSVFDFVWIGLILTGVYLVNKK